jgi:two-component system chemotaxis response regulator CheB
MIKIMIVDDSETEVAILKYLFQSEKDMTVVGVAKNGAEALKLIPNLKPDIITMDIQMPIMNGFETTRRIMAEYPTPVVVISSAVSDPTLNATFLSLEAGALSVLKKPHNINSEYYTDEKKRIVETIRSMAEIKVIRRRFHKTEKKQNKVADLKGMHRNYEIVAIGTSVGGPQALRVILEKLPENFPIPIVIVQHMTQGFIYGFAKWLNSNTHLKVKNALDQEVLLSGHVYFAPDHHHLEIRRHKDRLLAHLVTKEPVSGFCPSATVLLQSVAKVCGKNAIGILLTGMGHDGAQGLLELKKAGGLTLIQDKESATVFGMAGTAEALGAVDKIIELDQMAAFLMKIIDKK